jgi:hypothetical protein
MMWMFDIRGKDISPTGYTRIWVVSQEAKGKKQKSGQHHFFNAAAETESDFDFDAWGSGALRLIWSIIHDSELVTIPDHIIIPLSTYSSWNRRQITNRPITDSPQKWALWIEMVEIWDSIHSHPFIGLRAEILHGTYMFLLNDIHPHTMPPRNNPGMELQDMSRALGNRYCS